MHAGTPFGVLVAALADGGAVVLSGAGLSTESGIPDYRGPSGQARAAAPMTYQAFTSSAAARQRYWARSHLGWRHITGAAPNAGHRAVAALERRGLLPGIITQNVDGLHQAAGAAAVTELHGSLHRVVCLVVRAADSAARSTSGCGRRTRRGRRGRYWRRAGQPRRSSDTPINPDGDVALEDDRRVRRSSTAWRAAGC